MDNVYVVKKCSGEYYEYIEANVCAFLDREQAEQFCEEHNDTIKTFKQVYSLLREHMNNFPIPYALPLTESAEYYRLINSSELNNKQKDRRNFLFHKLEQIGEEYIKIKSSEKINFINNCDLLTAAQKELYAINGDDINCSYEVEEIELKD